MALRTLCVILVLVIHSPVRWVFAVLAVVLPYIAVVMANAAGQRRGRGGGRGAGDPGLAARRPEG